MKRTSLLAAARAAGTGRPRSRESKATVFVIFAAPAAESQTTSTCPAYLDQFDNPEPNRRALMVTVEALRRNLPQPEV